MRYYTKYGFLGWFFFSLAILLLVLCIATSFIPALNNSLISFTVWVISAIPLACLFYYYNRWEKYVDLLPGRIEITFFSKEKKDTLSIQHPDIEYVEYILQYYGLKNAKFKVDYLIHLYNTKEITQLSCNTIAFDQFTAYCKEYRIPLRELKLDD